MRDLVQVYLSSVYNTGLCPLQQLRKLWQTVQGRYDSNLVDPASSHMLVSKIKPCMSQYKLLYGETANGSLKQL